MEEKLQTDGEVNEGGCKAPVCLVLDYLLLSQRYTRCLTGDKRLLTNRIKLKLCSVNSVINLNKLTVLATFLCSFSRNGEYNVISCGDDGKLKGSKVFAYCAVLLFFCNFRSFANTMKMHYRHLHDWSVYEFCDIQVLYCI